MNLLLKGDDTMATKLEKDLQAVVKQLNEISKKVEKLSKAISKLEIAGKGVKAKKAKKASAKRKAVKTKTVAKKAISKKTKKKTAAETVLGLIQRYKRGRDTKSLVAQTGYDQKKIANIIYKLSKQGKIQSPEKGVYIKV